MAASQGQRIREHLENVFAEAGYDEAMRTQYLDELDIFDSFHDFGNQRKYKMHYGICCTSILNKYVSTTPGFDFLKSKDITPHFKEELETIGWENAIEPQIRQKYEREIPNVLRLTPGEETVPSTTVTYSQIIENPTILSSAPLSSITIQGDIDLIDEHKSIVATAILEFLFGVPTEPQGIFFTYDASTNITRDICINLNDTQKPGFYVGQLITPQNVCDSAISCSNSGVFKDMSFNGDVLIPDEGTHNKRTRFVFNLEDNTSNFFSKDFTTFKLKKLPERPFNLYHPYNLDYIISLKNGDAEKDVSIAFSVDDTNKKGKDGPSVPYLESIISDRPIADVKCATVEQLLIKIGEMYSMDEFRNRINRVLFDIKRSGDHEQANALWVFNNTENNPHRGVFQTLDILSALYSRILGNPTIITSKSTQMNMYKGIPNTPNPDELAKQKLISLLSYVNRILGVYLSVVSVYEDSKINELITHLNTRNEFASNTDTFVTYFIRIKAADAVYTIQQIKNELVFSDNNTNSNASHKIERIKDTIQEIYSVFGKTPNPENPLSEFNILIPDITILTPDQVGYYNMVLEEFIDQTKDSFKICEQYFNTLSKTHIIISERGTPTSVNIQTFFFLIDDKGKKNKYVDTNITIGFEKDQIKTKRILSGKTTTKESVRNHIINFIKSLMSAHKYLTDSEFTELFDRIDDQYSDDTKIYYDNITNNILMPFLEKIENLITAQSGGALKNTSNKNTLYDLFDMTLSFINKKLITSNKYSNPFTMIMPTDIQEFKLAQVFNDNCKRSASLSIDRQHTMIADALLKMNATIRNFSAVKYFSEKDIALMGGDLWIAQIFIAIAKEFEEMYLELEPQTLNSVLQGNLSNLYKYVFIPYIKKFKSMYNPKTNDYMIDLSSFSKGDIHNMSIALEVFGTELPRGLNYISQSVQQIINHIISHLKSLSKSNIHSKVIKTFGGKHKTRRRKTKSRRTTRNLKKKNK